MNTPAGVSALLTLITARIKKKSVVCLYSEKSILREMPTVRAFQNGHGFGMAEVAPDNYTFSRPRDMQNIKFVKAPAHPYALPDVPPGTQLNVRQRFVTDDKCPLGAGKLACVLDGHYVIVFSGSRGVAWIKVPHI